jgi:hypothetical protein
MYFSYAYTAFIFKQRIVQFNPCLILILLQRILVYCIVLYSAISTYTVHFTANFMTVFSSYNG